MHTDRVSYITVTTRHGEVLTYQQAGGDLRFKLRDPRTEIVRHHVHPGHSAPLRDGARIAREGAGDM